LAPKPPVQQIAIGPGVAQPAVTAAEPPQAAVSQEAAPASSDQGPLAVAAAHQGEQLVAVPAVGREPTRLVPQTASTGRTYQAVSGDTLSGIAARLPGGNTKANREALIAVNPDLKANPNLIVAGRTYNLPAAAGATAKTAPQPAAHSAQAATTPQRWYTVKAGDSLWKIANEQTGTAATLDTIRRLNKETLNGKDVVRVGMKLRLPAHNEVATTD
jgi:nucleoid-associated protein YgaU